MPWDRPIRLKYLGHKRCGPFGARHHERAQTQRWHLVGAVRPGFGDKNGPCRGNGSNETWLLVVTFFGAAMILQKLPDTLWYTGKLT